MSPQEIQTLRCTRCLWRLALASRWSQTEQARCSDCPALYHSRQSDLSCTCAVTRLVHITSPSEILRLEHNRIFERCLEPCETSYVSNTEHIACNEPQTCCAGFPCIPRQTTITGTLAINNASTPPSVLAPSCRTLVIRVRQRCGYGALLTHSRTHSRTRRPACDAR